MSAKNFAVTRRWRDNPSDYQVLEFFHTIDECETYIKEQPKSPFYIMEIQTYGN